MHYGKNEKVNNETKTTAICSTTEQTTVRNTGETI